MEGCQNKVSYQGIDIGVVVRIWDVGQLNIQVPLCRLISRRLLHDLEFDDAMPKRPPRPRTMRSKYYLLSYSSTISQQYFRYFSPEK